MTGMMGRGGDLTRSGIAGGERLAEATADRDVLPLCALFGAFRFRSPAALCILGAAPQCTHGSKAALSSESGDTEPQFCFFSDSLDSRFRRFVDLANEPSASGVAEDKED